MINLFSISKHKFHIPDDFYSNGSIPLPNVNEFFAGHFLFHYVRIIVRIYQILLLANIIS